MRTNYEMRLGMLTAIQVSIYTTTNSYLLTGRKAVLYSSRLTRDILIIVRELIEMNKESLLIPNFISIMLHYPKQNNDIVTLFHSGK